MAIGKMDTIGALQVNTPTTTSTGGGVDSYATVLSCWGHLKKMNGRRLLDSGEVVMSSSLSWTVYKHENLTNNLSKSARWLINGKLYVIHDINSDHPEFYHFVLNHSQ